MPKPTIGDWRSGAHINFSMEDVNKPGKNIFTDGKSWSKESKYAVGGLMKHSEALTSITCSTVNSYNGLVPRVGGFEGGTVTWAPTILLMVIIIDQRNFVYLKIDIALKIELRI